TAVAYLMTSEPDRFAKLVESLRSVVPDVGQFRVRPAKVLVPESRSMTVDDKRVSFMDERKVVGDELVFDMTGAQEIPASSVSEGTLLALALLTLLWSPDCPNLVLLDDIEQGLHPRAQRELIAQLRKILEQRPELQIVLTSHSPYIVDELEADEVWLLATDEEGVAQARRLSDHPDAERALEVLTTGEFWSAEGEDWVVADGK
ncbi:MAG: ATP-binding protein, partial [Bacteroidetes bacterium]|nr:ATP-binding protein [Bacteroidota bacterium]